MGALKHIFLRGLDRCERNCERLGHMHKKDDRINVRITETVKRKLVMDATLRDVKISHVVRAILAGHYANRRTP